MSRTYPRIAALKTAAQFQAHVASLGTTLPFDAVLQSAPESPLAAAIDTSAGPRRQPVLHPADGGLGRHDRRTAHRAHAPALAALRRERREVDLGRRGGRRPARRPRQPEPVVLGPTSEADLVQLRDDLLAGTASAGLDTDDLVIGLQLTHSGRYSRPDPDKQTEAAGRLSASGARSPRQPGRPGAAADRR